MVARAPDKAAFEALKSALEEISSLAESDVGATMTRRIREGLALHAERLEGVRAVTDPVYMPRASYDPSDPKIVGLMVSLALIAQHRAPLADVRPSYGSGVYAIYYEGPHPFYERISGTETPIYVGKADPTSGDASTPREQGAKLTGRLIEHAKTIRVAETYALQHGLPDGLHPINLRDFSCRLLVCATNAQLVAEKHLIRMFRPVWNSETKVCWGMSKHGDSASTRKNKRSPWDVVHPGRLWALDAQLEDKSSPEEIRMLIDKTLDEYSPRISHASLLEEMLMALQQDDSLVRGLSIDSSSANLLESVDDEAEEQDQE